MSNLLHTTWRDPAHALAQERLLKVAGRIQPKSLGGHPSRITQGEGTLLAVTGPTGAAVSAGTSAHLGAFTGTWHSWNVPGTPVPDGTFALVRDDRQVIEACSDFAGSRTLWYAFTEDHLVISTSQRALVLLLGGFELNRAAVAWYLSSGSLGTSAAWDLRVKRLPRGARLILDRQAWSLRIEESPLRFAPRPWAPRDCEHALTEVLRTTLQGFDFGSARWGFPLSGGYDCRFMLTQLVEGGLRPETMTWGLEASQHAPGNDAYVAAQLARHYDLPHEYLLTEMSEEGPGAIVDAFLLASGGGTDQLFPYLDGMRLWTSLSERGFDGIIRGDEGFGWIPVRDDQHARTSVGMMLLTDFMDPATAEAIAGGPQPIPAGLERHSDETLEMYRDRLYHGFRIPVGLAALNEVKAPYVEIASPLLSRPVLEFIREMPDALRTDKALFRRLATALSPAIPYATMSADDDRNDYLRTGAYPHWMRATLQTPQASELFPEAFLSRLTSHLGHTEGGLLPRRDLRGFLKRIIPSGWVKAVRAQMGPILPSPRLLALRAALITRQVALLREDARAWGGE
ncbi:MAG: hypothetical protein HYZ13_13730 [Acidobacteria bacterium]|nr:hypothetical protein [Acidobacteriota bacterium]